MPKDVKGVMSEFKSGDLHSGSKTGPVVTNRKQAIAIALSEQRKKSGAPPMPRTEAVPGLMATRQALRGMRADSIRHVPKSQRHDK